MPEFYARWFAKINEKHNNILKKMISRLYKFPNERIYDNLKKTERDDIIIE